MNWNKLRFVCPSERASVCTVNNFFVYFHPQESINKIRYEIFSFSFDDKKKKLFGFERKTNIKPLFFVSKKASMKSVFIRQMCFSPSHAFDNAVLKGTPHHPRFWMAQEELDY